jgi:glycine/D-amino acid oxidase-like deaminating enzyme
MLFEQLSFWEKESYLQGLDFVIVGAGIVGTTSALFLKERYPEARILVIDKGILPLSASTKNAGFACFGSPAELMDDLANLPEETVWETVALRWDGLQDLRKLVPDSYMKFEQKGSYYLLFSD